MEVISHTPHLAGLLPYPFSSQPPLIDEMALSNPNARVPNRRSFTDFPICFDPVVLRIHFHLGHRVVELHVLLAHVACILHRLDAFGEVVFGDCSRGDGGGGDECY